MQSLEDLTAGDAHEFGAYDVTEAEVLEFVKQYNPQWSHTDPERVEFESMYGGAIVSGWHTMAITMYLLVDGFLGGSTALGAKGVDRLRWWKSVYPGDTLVVENEVLKTTVEADSRDLVEIRTTTCAERESGEVEKVCSFVSYAAFTRRDDDAK